MKPEEAIEVLSNELIVITDMIGYCKDFEKESDLALAYRVKRQEAHNAAISAIKEVQQYREIGTVEQVRNQKHNLEMAYKIISDYEAIGTVEECREAVEKQKAEKIEYETNAVFNNGFGHDRMGKCPICDSRYNSNDEINYCSKCGKKLDWSEENE